MEGGHPAAASGGGGGWGPRHLRGQAGDSAPFQGPRQEAAGGHLSHLCRPGGPPPGGAGVWAVPLGRQFQGGVFMSAFSEQIV